VAIIKREHSQNALRFDLKINWCNILLPLAMLEV